MAAEDRRHAEQELEPDLEQDLDATRRADELEVSRFQALLQDRRKIVSGVLARAPAGRRRSTCCSRRSSALDEAMASLDEANWYWVVIAIGFNVLAFGAYVALFRGVLGGTRDDERAPAARLARLVPDHDGRAGGHADLLGRRARAASCSPTGRSARRACRAGARPAGWSPSWC